MVQDPAYNHPEVPLDRGVYKAFSETFNQGGKMHGQSSPVDCSVKDPAKMPLWEDCSAAIASGIQNLIVGLLQGRKGGNWWATVSIQVPALHVA
jgi:hypothetical protein